MSTFAKKPSTVSSRYDSIFAACQQGQLKTKELEQYFRAMVTEREEQGIAAFYKEEGFREGMEKGMEKGMENSVFNMLDYGMAPEDISKALKLPLETVLSLKEKTTTKV